VVSPSRLARNSNGDSWRTRTSVFLSAKPAFRSAGPLTVRHTRPRYNGSSDTRSSDTHRSSEEFRHPRSSGVQRVQTPRSSDTRSSDTQEFRHLGVQEFRSSDTRGVQTPAEFRHPRSPGEFRHPGVQTPGGSSDTRDPPGEFRGVQTPEFRHPGVQTPAIPTEFRHPRSPGVQTGVQTPAIPRSSDGSSDTRDPPEFRSSDTRDPHDPPIPGVQTPEIPTIPRSR
jgi:hypothetical protein